MSVRNKKLVMSFLDGFINGNKQKCINYLTDDVRWNIIGMPSIRGKQNFLQALEMMELWKSTFLYSPSGRTKNIIAEKDYVVVESAGGNSNSANCDIYKIINGKIREMTSYIVDTSVNE